MPRLGTHTPRPTHANPRIPPLALGAHGVCVCRVAGASGGRAPHHVRTRWASALLGSRSLAVTQTGRMFWWGLIHASDNQGSNAVVNDGTASTHGANDADAEAVARANSHATARRGGGARPISERVRNLVQESEWLYLSCGEGAGAFAENTPSTTSTASAATADVIEAVGAGAGDRWALRNTPRRRTATPSGFAA